MYVYTIQQRMKCTPPSWLPNCLPFTYCYYCLSWHCVHYVGRNRILCSLDLLLNTQLRQFLGGSSPFAIYYYFPRFWPRRNGEKNCSPFPHRFSPFSARSFSPFLTFSPSIFSPFSPWRRNGEHFSPFSPLFFAIDFLAIFAIMEKMANNFSPFSPFIIFFP